MNLVWQYFKAANLTELAKGVPVAPLCSECALLAFLSKSGDTCVIQEQPLGILKFQNPKIFLKMCVCVF